MIIMLKRITLHWGNYWGVGWRGFGYCFTAHHHTNMACPTQVSRGPASTEPNAQMLDGGKGPTSTCSGVWKKKCPLDPGSLGRCLRFIAKALQIKRRVCNGVSGKTVLSEACISLREIRWSPLPPGALHIFAWPWRNEQKSRDRKLFVWPLSERVPVASLQNAQHSK